MKKLNALWFGSLFWLIGCSGGVEIHYDFSQPLEYQVYREGTYSTQNQVGEVVGTINRWWTTEALMPREGGAVWTRKYDVQKGEGYHRHSLPSELSMRVPLLARVTLDSMSEIKGFSHFVEDVVELLPMRKIFKEPLRDPSLISRFESELKLWWKATHLLQGRLPKSGAITAELAALHGGSIDLAPLEVDSVIALGTVKVENRNCLNYKIYYKLSAVPDLDLLFEQFRAADTVDRAAYADFQVVSGKADGSWNIWIDPKQGALCREQDWRDLELIVAHKESGENRQIVARTAVERLYTYDLAEQTSRFLRKGSQE